MKLKSLTLALVAAGVLATGSASAIGWNPSEWFGKRPAATNTQVAAAAPDVPAPSTKPDQPPLVSGIAAPNYRAIVERFGPAVVGINTEGTVKASAADLPDDLANDPFFKFFQGIPGFQGPRGRAPRSDIPVRGQGSGFIIGKNGLILTNAHVVRNANEVTVKLNDRREYKAKVLGSDASTDVAVLKIDASNLPVVNFGDPARLGVGDYVLAIGSPFGFEQSATAGIVSAKGRSLPGDSYVPFIQTDVAVNPGNSGGPLFDASGNVVGINSQIYSQTGGYQGVSFAIPIDVALKVKDQIVATGKVVHARLGVSVQEVSQPLADSFKLKQPEGALVGSVVPGSAAAKAGLQPGDIVLKYNGEPIIHSGDLSAKVGLAKPGDRAALEIWRGGKQQQLTATLAKADDAVASDDTGSASDARGKLGVAVRALTPEEKQAAHMNGGVVVQQAVGPAARAGIEAGDIILSVNGKPVQGVADLQKMVKEEKRHLALLIQRGEDKIFVPVNLG